MLVRIFFLLCLPLTALAQERYPEREGLAFSASTRTPEQTTAFYAARGFPEAMVREIAATCFVTVGLQNRRDEVVWLELDQWRFTDAAGQPVARITRPEWNRKWESRQVPLSARATFGWTQLPEARDLQPGEPVGGNVAVVAPKGSFSLNARFRTASGKHIEIVVPGLSCPRQGAAP